MSRDYIGVDVGGTKVSLSVMRDGTFSQPRLTATERSEGERLIAQLTQLISGEAASSGRDVAAVGLGIPSVIEFETGRVRSSVNVPLRDVPLREVLRERLGLPVYVDNDGTCAALAEAHDEHGRLDVRDLVMLTVGTGVGGGIVIDGRIYRGATGAAGEIGHMIVGLRLDDGVPEPTDFPQRGSLEALAAGRALDQLAAQAAAAHPDSALGRAAAGGEAVAGPDAVKAAQEGDRRAIDAIAELGARLGVGIANAINIFDPEVVAIGGGVSAAGDLLLGPARDTARRFILPGVGTRTEIRLARSGPQAGVRGAALLAAQELEREHREHGENTHAASHDDRREN
jgi:glucokinase